MKFYQEVEYTHQSKVTKLWASKAPLIARFNSQVQTVKTSHLESFKVCACYILTNPAIVMAFYNTQHFKH